MRGVVRLGYPGRKALVETVYHHFATNILNEPPLGDAPGRAESAPGNRTPEERRAGGVGGKST